MGLIGKGVLCVGQQMEIRRGFACLPQPSENALDKWVSTGRCGCDAGQGGRGKQT